MRPLAVTVPDPADPTGASNITLAESPFSVHLHETLLPTRYYLPLSCIPPALLRRSATRTGCPYKGEAEYYDVVLSDERLGRAGVNGHVGGGHAGKARGKGEVMLKDIVWYYSTPKPEVAAVAGMCCFYNEHVDVWLDGVKLERPKTFWSS